LVFGVVIIGASIILFDGLPRTPLAILVVVGIGLIPVMVFALFPMLKFKPQVRVLTLDESGIATSIGHHNATIPWNEVVDVRDDGEALVIQRRNLNAFIVPARAFETSEAREQFSEFVQARFAKNGS
jgi:hypothetical protein